MELPHLFKKFVLVFSLFLVGINPVFAETELDFFPNATSNAEITIVENTKEGTVIETVSVAPQVEVSGRVLVPQPIIRVGLYKTVEAVKVKSDFVYEVWSGGVLWGTVEAAETIQLSYAKGIYTVQSFGLEFASKEHIRLVPVDPNSFFTLVNYSRPVAGRKKINFNAYRGILEYRFSPKSNAPYVINELPLDLYVQGIAESSDGVPTEYSKALAVAARSYAYALIAPPTEKRMFDVYATTRDQLYLGYNSEGYMPNFLASAKATAGEMVTYKGQPVITFYFSRSNGQTKSGGKDRPWLAPVTAVYDTGKKMLGHGIGMSNTDAQLRATKDKWSYTQILTYYYSDTIVEKVF
jgi:hypothetical protein